jgi:hypothetical protein
MNILGKVCRKKARLRRTAVYMMGGQYIEQPGVYRIVAFIKDFDEDCVAEVKTGSAKSPNWSKPALVFTAVTVQPMTLLMQ